MNWQTRACVAALALSIAAYAHAAGTLPRFSVSAPASVTLAQDGVATIRLSIDGHGFRGGAFGLSSRTGLNLSASARLYGDAGNKVGFSFDCVGARGGNLTLYVGNDVPAGSYPLTVAASAGGATRTASFVLRVLPHGTEYQVWPSKGASYQNYLPRLRPGDELVLHQGTYRGDAFVDLGGTAARPIVIRGYGHGEAKPVLAYAGRANNEWEVRASNVVIEGLEFVSPHADSIRVRPLPARRAGAIRNVTLVDDTFADCGSECVTANDPDVTYGDIRMIDNLIVGTRYTAVYVGNQQGSGAFRNFLFEGNVIDGRSIVATDVVGYGIEVKLNVENAELRNNYVVGARGPGIMTYGLKSNRDPAYRATVEGNIVIGSCTDEDIDIGAGPAVVRRNLVLGGYSDGLGVAAYHNWPLLSGGIRVERNTAALNAPYGFWVTPWTRGTGLDDLRMSNNLAYVGSGGQGFGGLPTSNGRNWIEGNRVARANATMVVRVDQLRGLVPSPQALKPIWPRLAGGPLDANQLTQALDALASLPNQSSNSVPRACD